MPQLSKSLQWGAAKALPRSFPPQGSAFSSLPRALRAVLRKGKEHGEEKKKKKKAGLKIAPLATVPENRLS